MFPILRLHIACESLAGFHRHDCRFFSHSRTEVIESLLRGLLLEPIQQVRGELGPFCGWKGLHVAGRCGWIVSAFCSIMKVPTKIRRGFTLIELLVVVAIITILAALLLPVLARAKDSARRVQCISNQKQMAVAWALYPVDNKEFLVPNGGRNSSLSLPPATAYLWVYGGNHGDDQTLTNKQYLVGDNYALFAPYLKSPELYKCAADRTLWPLKGKGPVFELRSYAMNCYLGTGAANVETPLALLASYRVLLKSSELVFGGAANRFVFIDVNPGSICTPGFGVDMAVDSFVHYPSTLHRGQGVVSFADSHVEAHKWVDGRTRRNLTAGSVMIPHWEASIGNADLKWIRDHTTVRK